MAGVALDVSSSRAMDRLVRSRIWIGVIAFALLGMVATQVSLLKLNTGISNAVQTASTLERSNAGLRREVSRLSSPERIRPKAEALGLVMPAPADIEYLRSRDTRAAAKRAAANIQAPDPAVAGPAGNVVTADPAPGSTADADPAAAQAPNAAAADPEPATGTPTPPAAPAPAQAQDPAPVAAATAPAPASAPAPVAQAGTTSGGASAQQASAPAP
ncbi:MAG: hypothetical protein ACR2LK_14280 [Solirubrobacteraceae bacterium]